MVGTGRFELPTPRTPSECSTRLSHVPTRLRTRRSNGVDLEILHHRDVELFEFWATGTYSPEFFAPGIRFLINLI